MRSRKNFDKWKTQIKLVDLKSHNIHPIKWKTECSCEKINVVWLYILKNTSIRLNLIKLPTMIIFDHGNYNFIWFKLTMLFGRDKYKTGG